MRAIGVTAVLAVIVGLVVLFWPVGNIPETEDPNLVVQTFKGQRLFEPSNPGARVSRDLVAQPEEDSERPICPSGSENAKGLLMDGSQTIELERGCCLKEGDTGFSMFVENAQHQFGISGILDSDQFKVDIASMPLTTCEIVERPSSTGVALQCQQAKLTIVCDGLNDITTMSSEDFFTDE